MAMNPYSAILFDFEGTLVDFQWKIDEAIHEALATLAMLGFDEELFQGCDYADLFNSSIEQAGKLGLSPQKTLEKLGEIYDRYDLDALDRWGPKGDALFVLENLIMRGVLTGLVTNVGQKALSIFLQRFRFQGLFKVVVTRNHVGRLKPDGEGIFRAMKTLKVEKRKCLYVGDSVNDIITTKEVGIDVAVVPGGESKTLDIKTNNPSFILDSLTDVLSLV